MTTAEQERRGVGERSTRGEEAMKEEAEGEEEEREVNELVNSERRENGRRRDRFNHLAICQDLRQM